MKNQTSFKKGHKKIGDCGAPKGSHNSPNTEFKKGSLPHNYKGEEAGYHAKHAWIGNKRGKPNYCEHCKRDDFPNRYYHWANIDGKYRRVLSDYIRLCAKCHGAFDKINKLRKNSK